MGSRSISNLAYIAGFLDGDGSIMFQVKQRQDGGRKWRFMCTICFYQDRRHAETLYWIRDILGIGYISNRNDGMTELRVNGFQPIRDILKKLLPYIRFKKVQAQLVYEATDLLCRYPCLTQAQLIWLVDAIITVQHNNYTTRSKKSREELLVLVGLTP